MRLAPLKPMPKTPMPYVPAAAARSGADDFAGAVAARAAQQAVRKEADALANMGANQTARAAQNTAINIRQAGSVVAQQTAKKEADRLANIGANQAARAAQNAAINARQAGSVAAQQAARQTAKREVIAQSGIAANQAARATQNATINTRQAGYYAREQAANRAAAAKAANTTIPISNSIFQDHIINATVKGQRLTGGHTALGNVRVDRVINEFPNGVYNAEISAKNAAGQWIKKSNNNGESTMFPRSWTPDRVKVEVDAAFQNRTPHPTKADGWQGITPSGVKVEGFINKTTGQISTVYPLKAQ